MVNNKKLEKKLTKKLSKVSMAMESHIFNRLPSGTDNLLFQQNQTIDKALEDACIFDEDALHEFLSKLNRTPPLRVRVAGVFIYLFCLLLPGMIIISIFEFLNYPNVAMENYTMTESADDVLEPKNFTSFLLYQDDEIALGRD